MSNVNIAYRTLNKIDEMVHNDQGSAYRGILKNVLPHIEDAYRTEEEGHRSHLGASILGGECPRSIWYNFNWATKSSFPGRIIRLFNRGHLEEGRLISLLLMIGCQVYQQDEEGKQFRISFGDGHAGGSGDGKIYFVPDLDIDTQALGEFKTHGEKSFIDLAGSLITWRAHLEDPTRNKFNGKGLRDSKFEHFVQMQLYMYKMGIAAGLYMAINKNTDDLYAEIITLDTILADQFIQRGESIVWMKTAPKRISKSPGFFKCRFCSDRPVCHLNEKPDINCRTCYHSEPSEKGTWKCTNEICSGTLTMERQLAGCSNYELDENYL